MSTELSIEFIKSASTVLKILGNPTRLEIVEYLKPSEKSVGQIQRYLGVIQPVTSQHLRFMYKNGILKYRRSGITYYYSIANEFIYKILDCLSECQYKVQSSEWEFNIGDFIATEV